MKLLQTIFMLAMVLFGTSQCTSPGQQSETPDDQLSVSGVITDITNGKDGYMATIQSDDDKTYEATISIVNLQKSGGEYKRYEIGDRITVKGPFWEDESGFIHITVSALE